MKAIFSLTIITWLLLVPNLNAQDLNCNWLTYSQVSSSLVRDIIVDHDDYTIAYGTFKEINIQGTTLNSSPEDIRNIFLCKLDSSGNVQWLRNVGAETTGTAKSVVIDSYNNIVITGSFRDSITIYDTVLYEHDIVGEFITKINPEGDLLWANYVDFVGSFGALPIAIDPFNEIYLCTPGSTTINGVSQEGETVITKFGPAGNVKWMNPIEFDVHEELSSTNNTVVADSHQIIIGGYFRDTIRFAGHTYISGIEWDVDPYSGDTFYFSSQEAIAGVVDFYGNEICAIDITGIGDFTLEAITMNNDQEYFLQGRYYSDSIYFGDEYLTGGVGYMLKCTNDLNIVNAYNIQEIRTYGAVTTNNYNYYSSQNWQYMYISKIDFDGSLVETVIIGDTNLQPEYPQALAKYSNNSDIVLGGAYIDDIWIDSLYAPGNPYNGGQLFVARFQNSTQILVPSYIQQDFKLFPNPAKDIIAITLDSQTQLYEVQIFNNVGKLLFTTNDEFEQVDISHLAPGLYIVKLTGDAWTASRKLIVQ